MQEFDKIYFRKKITCTLDGLEKRGFEPYFFETPSEGRRFMLEQIKAGETVGVGGSVTLRQELDLIEEIRKKENKVYDHWEVYNDPVQRFEVQKKHREVDVFLSGINAITTDGVLVNLDGGGNRIASLCSGPKRVIAIAGVNKLVASLDLAIDRVRNKAAVLNAMRIGAKTPCVQTGSCSDCDSPERICNGLLILYRKTMYISRFTVVLVNEAMGY